MLTIAIAAAASARLLGAVVDQQSRAELIMDSDQAWLVALAGERLALRVLKDDGDNSETDNLTESWAQDSGAIAIGGGTASGKFIDLQGRFNLNGLWDNAAFQMPAYQQLQRMLEAANVPAGSATAVAEWISAFSPPVPGASGDAPYLTLSPPYLRAEMPMSGPSELRLVEGIDAKAYRALASEVTALPSIVPINVNTAGPLVIRSLSNLIDGPGAEAIIAARAKQPFADIDAFRNAVGTAVGLAAAAEIPYDRLSVSSAYFLLEVKTQYGAGRAALYSLVHRPDGKPPEVLMRSQAPL